MEEGALIWKDVSPVGLDTQAISTGVPPSHMQGAEGFDGGCSGKDIVFIATWSISLGANREVGGVIPLDPVSAEGSVRPPIIPTS